MNEDTAKVTLPLSTAVLAEIMLILMGLSGISVVGVNIGYFHDLLLFIVIIGLIFGIFAIINCVIGIYVLLYQNYFRLKLFLKFLTLFIGLQSAFIIYLYFSTTYFNISNHHSEHGSLIALDVCCGLSASTLIALVFHLKEKGSTIEMFKF